ncbi:uncharacterized protein LOC133927396 [Phragmites australis]|uniref:uncharacterized protein LOC133927396 n=1 Tax=Phragmites australis TaxID=29695 RepID=UPI002D768A5F|nr:uncharacterized protein LOC133927396 [Phragmites australis]
MKHLLLPSPLPLLLHRPSKPLLLHHRRHLSCIPSAASDGSSGDPSPATSKPPSTDTTPSNSKPAGIKNRLRERNQARRVQLDAPPAPVTPKKKARSAAAPRMERQRGRKEWEEMSLADKAVELYVGEKGLLFWLNKFAYASIFIMVGAWVLFRFIGPSLGLYQLDAPPLQPSAVLGG